MIFLNQTLLLFWEYNYAVSLSLHIRTLPLVARGDARTADATLANALPMDQCDINIIENAYDN